MGGEGGKSSPDVWNPNLWNPNLWETPTHIAKAMAMILNEDEALILEPCAGTGQIARAIADIRDLAGCDCELMAIEILKERSEKLEDNRYFSIDADFIDFDFGDQRFDAVVTNPPFDIGLDILEKSLLLLKSGGRCLFLLPIAYFQTQERAKKFATFNAHIHGIYPIVGRVAYLKNGIPETGRQCDDAIFDVRLGADCEGGMEFIWQ
jgi:SAM-dependent methyltransferase